MTKNENESQPQVLWYAEYANGNCTILKAESKQSARESAKDSRFVTRLLRPATDEDVQHFTSMGGTIR